MAKPVKALSLTSKSLAIAHSPVRVKVSVIEPSDAVKRRSASLRSHLTLWLGLAWLDLVILHTYPPMKMEQSVPKRRHIKFRLRGITQKKAYNFNDNVIR